MQLGPTPQWMKQHTPGHAATTGYLACSWKGQSTWTLFSHLAPTQHHYVHQSHPTYLHHTTLPLIPSSYQLHSSKNKKHIKLNKTTPTTTPISQPTFLLPLPVCMARSKVEETQEMSYPMVLGRLQPQVEMLVWIHNVYRVWMCTCGSASVWMWMWECWCGCGHVGVLVCGCGCGSAGVWVWICGSAGVWMWMWECWCVDMWEC